MSVPSTALKFQHSVLGTIFVWEEASGKEEPTTFYGTQVRIEGQDVNMTQEEADPFISEVLSLREFGVAEMPAPDVSGPETSIAFQDGTGEVRVLTLSEFEEIVVERRGGYLEVFNVTLPSGELVVADPCYNQTKPNVSLPRGRYVGMVMHQALEDWGARNAMVGLLHVDADADSLSADCCDEIIGVDSGCVGLVDVKALGTGAADVMSMPPYPEQAVRPGAIVSSSGVGDGGYCMYLLRNGDQAVGVAVEFLEGGLPLTQLGKLLKAAKEK